MNNLENAKRVLFTDFHPNTELVVDLKLLTRQMKRMAIGEYLGGTIKRDGDYHYTFVENGDKAGTRVRRHPTIFSGKCINLHRRENGMPYPTFNRPLYTPEFTFRDFCQKAAEELLAVAGHVEK